MDDDRSETTTQNSRTDKWGTATAASRVVVDVNARILI